MKLKSINPSNKKIIGEVETSSEKEIKEKIKKAHKAKEIWRDLEIEGRVKLLRKIIDNFQKRKEEFAKLVSNEMGMPISLSRMDVDDARRYFNWYLDNAKKYLSPEIVFEDGKIKHTVYREPIGVAANITPWNFPASNFVWSVAQSLVSGNAVIYKTSEEVPLCGKMIEEIMRNSNLPEGVFSEVYGGEEVGKTLVNGDIDFICFTGSTKTGKYLYEVVAKRFIKIFLELGGSAPGIVFEDANIDKVLESIFGNRFLYCGQVCDDLKRLIVHKNKFDEVVDKLRQRIQRTKIGDPLKEGTEIGPLVSREQLKILEEQVKDALRKGAKAEIGGKRIDKFGGFFYQPTLLTNINKEMRVWNEEVFGPVLPVISFKTENEALELANDTRYGLGSYVFSENKERLERVARQLETGMVSTNNVSYLQPCSPFGGYKDSGIGREHGKFGFHDLTQVKVVAEEK
jgi:acyl-CoA reductase-like NAD-dependent aldehyde dehydrogenase